MKFKTDVLKAEFDALHPRTRSVLIGLDEHSIQLGLPDVVVTHVLRTLNQQEKIYERIFVEKLAMDEVLAKKKARAKFSWHLCRCAVDFRNNQYSEAEKREVLSFLKIQMYGATSQFEFVEHDIGHGNHFHLAHRDYEWKRIYIPRMELVS